MRYGEVSIALLILTTAAGCTQQIPNFFRLAQQEQTFSSQQEVNTKIDLLWVVDNSASMDVSQQKLRNGFSGFAQKYMQPTWDIRTAVITTDTYMANPAFAGYINRTIPSTIGYSSSYIAGRIATFVNPSWNPTLVNGSGVFTNGIKYGELVPVWGPNYARLLPGLHDGPITSLCMEYMPYFLSGVTRCDIRDNQNAYSGTSHCLNPDTGAGESSVSQCVNTVENDTVRSGKAIISTMPPEGTAPDSVWTSQLAKDFIINITTGSAGQGSERGLSSVIQFLQDNETSATAFFRPGSLRGVIFVTDEDDQSTEIPSSPPADFTPQYYNTSTCSPKTVDSHTYTVSVCPMTDKLIPVADFKTALDDFFRTIDQAAADASANYFITTITPTTAAAIQSLQAARTADDMIIVGSTTVAVDRGDRYLELGNLVGNGSMAMNIAENDYSPILEAIGRAIIDKKSTFTLSRQPTGTEDMLVKIRHADGSETLVDSSKYTISGKSLVFTDRDFMLSLTATDYVIINYQPKSLNE